MLKKFTWTVVLMPFITLLHGVMLGVEIVMLRAGTGSVSQAPHLPSFSAWWVTLIDTDEYKYIAATDEDDPWGLPDSHDFSKRKDFFAIYPSLYCSGEKKKQGGSVVYEADYCSAWGSQFDLQWLWRVWGVDLIQDNYIGQAPRIIFTSLMTGTCATGLTTALKVIGFCFFWFKVAALVVSWLSMACMCAMATTSHLFASKLVSGASSLKVGGTGHISAQMGNKINHYGWGLFAASCIAALLETFIVYWEYKKRRARRSGSPASRGRVTVVGGGPKGGVYQHLSPDGKEGLHASSQIELIPSSSGHLSREPSPMRDHGPRKSDITAQDSAYEPMRHRNVG